MADPVSGGGIYSRPGTTRFTGVSGALPQGVYYHTALDGSVYNFVFIDGKLFRWNALLPGAMTDVTPVGVTISPAVTDVYVTSLADSIIVNDGVNRPWIGTNLGGSPITGTYIDYDGAGGAWVAFGQPVIYTGAVFFILSSVGGVAARTTIAWSEPNQPGVGYQQTDYDNAWTLTQTGASPLYALAATNDALYYSRYLSWGAISGAPGVNFQNTATHDVVSANIGCISPRSVCRFSNYIYFADQNGRPQRFSGGGTPEPIWLQSQSNFESTRRTPRWAVIEPTLNLYIVGLEALTGGVVTVFVFDAPTGSYVGSWLIASVTDLMQGGVMWAGATASVGGPRVVFLQAASAGLIYRWKLATPEDNGWADNGTPISVAIVPGHQGYAATTGYLFTRAAAVVSHNVFPHVAPVLTMSVTTSQVSVPSATGTVAVGGGQNPLYKVIWMLDRVPGRGFYASISFNSSTVQLKLYRFEVDAVEQGDSGVTDF